MKSKTINTVIKKKMNQWLNSIENKELADQIKKDVVVTGGCLTSMLLNEPVNDFDVYFTTKETTKAVAEYYCEKFNDNNQDRTNGVKRNLHAWVLDGEDVDTWKRGYKRLSEFAYDYKDITYQQCIDWQNGDQSKNPNDYEEENEKENVRALNLVSGMLLNTPEDRVKVMVNSSGIAEDSDYIADNAEYDINEYLDALGDADEIDANEMEKNLKEKYKPIFLSTNAITLSDKIQIVIRFYGDPNEIHENYDFIHTTNYWTYRDGVCLNQRALEAILNKELLYVGSKYPIASMIRTRKFIKRGWQINAGQYVKIAWQINELDLTDIYVLEDQLVGVDSVYFLQFIHNMKQKMLHDKDFQLIQSYVTTVIDRIFG